MQVYWVKDLKNYDPVNLGGHWGDYQAGFNMSLSGRIWLTDNRSFPSHHSLIDGQGKDETRYSGIYSWKDNNPELYVYPFLEEILFRKKVQEGLRSLIGVHLIVVGTPVISNSSNEVLFRL